MSYSVSNQYPAGTKSVLAKAIDLSATSALKVAANNVVCKCTCFSTQKMITSLFKIEL